MKEREIQAKYFRREIKIKVNRKQVNDSNGLLLLAMQNWAIC